MGASARRAQPRREGWMIYGLVLLVALLTTAASVVLVAPAIGWPAALRSAGGCAVGLAATLGFVWLIRRQTGPEPGTLADALTLIRAGAGTLLLGGLCAGTTIWHGAPAWIIWGIALVGATVCDWLDGPLARRLGTTKLGAALDIEADSWLTLWCGVVAILWGGLPWWVAGPPLLHYLVPLRALWRSGVPSSEGPWWGRLTGTAQMAIFFVALLPLSGVVGILPRGMLDVLAAPVALAQGAATLAPLVPRRR